MQSVLNMGDTRVEPQLVKGFHGIEAAAWRWTEKQFTVALRPPFGASQKGAKLTVKLTVPPVTIEKLKSVALSATARGQRASPRDLHHARRLRLCPRDSGEPAHGRVDNTN